MSEISCVVVNYNKAEYLEKCIDSLLKQTMRVDEIIIADDCSTDRSRQILKKYREKFTNITLVLNEQNLGVTINRDNAIRKAKGKYITTLDSDDYYCQEKIEKEYNLIKENPDSVIASDTVDITEDEHVYNVRNAFIFCGYSKDERIDHLIWKSSSIVPRDMMFSKETYMKIGGLDRNFELYEDWEFKLRLCCFVDKWIHSGTKGTYYRHHKKGLSSKKKLTLFNYHLKAIIKNYKNSDKKNKYVYAIIKYLIIKIPIVVFGIMFNQKTKYTKHIN